MYFASKSLTAAQQNYVAIELEALAVSWAVQKLYHYLYGTSFMLQTDHAVPCSQNARVNLPPKHKDPNISSTTDKTDNAQPNLVLPSPESEDKSISAELVRAIIVKHGPEFPAKDGKVNNTKDQDRRPGTTKNDEIKCIMNNQPTITLRRLTSAEIEGATKPSTKKVTKIRKAEGIYPGARTASKYMFRLSQYGIKQKYKRKYTYKCQVEGCPKKFNNVGDWNKHHRSRHSSITYTCEKCVRISSSPIQHRDHIYLHKETQFTCGHCYKSFRSISRLNLH